MSMDDILKLLVESRQQRPSQQSDPMTDLIGGLLGGGQSQSGGGQADAITGMLGSLLGGGQPQSGGTNQQSDAMSDVLGSLLGGGQSQSQTGGGQADAMSGMLGSLLGGGQSQTGGQQSGLGGIMSLLEMFTGAGGQSGISQSAMGSNPLMGLIQPLVEPLAKKLKISPELAMIVVSFVLQKMLAHHPTSGRDSTQFDLDDLFNQVGTTGKINPNMLQTSGMVDELSRVTGMDQATAAKSLNTAFTMVGNRALQAAAKPAGRTLKSAASSGRKITR
jgi:hypothetical protein